MQRINKRSTKGMNLMKKKTAIVVFSTLLAWSGVASGQDFEQYKKHSIYTDYKAAQVGDIVTIMIIESTSGSGQSNSNNSEKGSMKASGKVTGNLASFLPLFGADASFESDNSGKAAANQTDALTGRITALVTEISPTGNLTLQGRRRLEVNGEAYILEVKGMARQKDITSDNIVLSYHLANVEISYKKDGLINKIGKPALIARWTTWAMIAGLGVSAIWGIGAAAN